MRRVHRPFCAAAALALVAVPAISEPLPPGVAVHEAGSTAQSMTVTLGLDKSTVVELDRPAFDVVITNAEIADAVVQNTKRIIFRGVMLGQTNAYIYDQHGREILSLDIRVETDLTDLEHLLVRHLPTGRVSADSVNGNIVISGTVDSASDAEQAIQLASLHLGDDAQIVNLLSVSAKDQVLLEVRVVEMQRTFLKQLGLNPSGDIGFGDLANQVEKDVYQQAAPGEPFIATGQQALAPALPFSNESEFDFGSGFSSSGGLNAALGYQNFVLDELQSQVQIAIEALERVGIARTLAEPNITAVSGESANFLAGGEFPVPTPPDDAGRVGIEFKQFGVGLGFTPIVLSEDRISLKVSTEVSELTSQGALGDIPALTVRRVESTVELPSGKSMMLAGLIQTRSRQELDKVPGLKNLPVLGPLFQSRDFATEESELVVIITPYLVDPTTKKRLRTPADGFAYASDEKTLLFGKLNQVYGGGGTVDGSDYRAPVGFIEE